MCGARWYVVLGPVSCLLVLLTCFSDGAVVHVHVAYDANSIDEARFEAFKDAMESLLKPKADAKL